MNKHPEIRTSSARRGRLVRACLLCNPPAYTVDQDEIEEPMTREAAAPYSLDAINIQIGALEDFMMKRRDVGMSGREMQEAIAMVQRIDQHVGNLMKLLR
jgi:hypothetical protein